MEQLINLVINAAFVLSLTSLYVFFPIVNKQNKLWMKILTGFLFSAVTIAIMLTTVSLPGGTKVDSRLVVINIAFLFFNPIVGVMTTITAIFARIFLVGGSDAGMISGIAGMLSTMFITLLYKKYRFDKIRNVKPKRLMDIFLLAFFIRMIYTATSYIFIPTDIMNGIMLELGVWLLFAYPLITVFFAQILFYSDDYFTNSELLIESQKSFVLAIEKSPYPIALYDEEGNFVTLNKEWLRSTGYSKDDFNHVYDWLDVALDEVQAKRLKQKFTNIQNIKLDESDGNFEIRTKDGKQLIWEIRRERIGLLPNGKQGFISIAINVTEKIELQDKLIYENYHDYLTNLYNRRFLNHFIDRLANQNMAYQMILIDFNDFKKINDRHGYSVGDAYLIHFSQILHNFCTAEEYSFRLGGDEFLIISSKSEVDVSKLISTIAKEFSLESKNSLDITFSFGVSEVINLKENFNLSFTDAENKMYQYKTLHSSSLRGMPTNKIMETLKEKDKNTNKHSEAVSKIAVEIAISMGLSDHNIAEIRKIALLHDIGKILISTSILNSPGKLDEQEYTEIKKHPEIGYRILSSDKSTAHIAPYVLYHHERIDGLGYPKGITGDKIPIQSKIISVADAFDAMISDRSYRDKMDVPHALVELEKNAGTQFDIDVVKALISIYS